jgi:hypothetical protein
MVTQAEYNKVITLNETASIEIQKWYDTTKSYYTTDSFFKFTHDMRYA